MSAQVTTVSGIVGRLPRGWAKRFPSFIEPRAICLTGPTPAGRHGYWLELTDTQEEARAMILRLPPTSIEKPELVPHAQMKCAPKVERELQTFCTGRTFGGLKMIGAEYVELVGDDRENGPFERHTRWFRLDYVRIAERIFGGSTWDLDDNLCLSLVVDGQEVAVIAAMTPPAGTIAAVRKRQEKDNE